MWPRVRTTSEWKGAVLVVACLLLGSCSRKPVNSGPYVVFDKVPNATLGGPDKLETIKGRVLGAGPGQQIVLYAKSEGLWWIQPFTEKPFTKIENGRRWENETHLGTEYAALLVEPGYRPPPTTENLPGIGFGVVALDVVQGQGPALPSRQSRHSTSAATTGPRARLEATAAVPTIPLIPRMPGPTKPVRSISA